MPDNIVINIPDYGSYSQEEIQQQYGEDWLKAVDKLEGTVDIPDYGSYSYSDLKDAYGDDIPKALSQLSSKKKVQEEEEPEPVQEEVQEDTESPSEDISLESSSTDDEVDSQDWRGDQKKSVAPVLAADEETFKSLEKEGSLEDVEEKIELDSFGKPMSQKEEEEEYGVYRSFKKQKAKDVITPEYLYNVLKTNALDVPLDELTQKSLNQTKGLYESDVTSQLSALRYKELNTLADTFLDEEKKSIAEGIVEDNPGIEIGAAEAMASDSLFQETFKFGMSKLNLNEEDLATYKTDIENRSKDLKRRSELINKINKINSQINDVPIEQKKELLKEQFSIAEELKLLKESVALSDKKIAELRENEKGFTDAEGNVNQELKKKQEDIGKRVIGFEKEYKSDYNKIYARLAQEKAKQDALKNALLSKLSPDLYQALGGDDEVIEQKINSVFSSYGGLDVFKRVLSRIEVSSSNRVGNEEIVKVMEIASSYFNEYKEAEKNSTALSRLIFLNEDPAKVERGFGAVEGESYFEIPFQKEIGQVVTSIGETFVKELGVDVDTDKEFREAAINIAQQENLTLTPEQIESGNASFPEKLGEGLAISLKIGAEIALTRGIMGGASKLVSMPKYLARIQTLRNSPKLVKFIEGTTDVLLEGLAFELADKSTDFAMGSAESLSNKGMDALVKRVSKSKLGKYFKFLDNYAGRFVKEVTGRASGGIIEEYIGDFVSEGVKNGFFTEEQFKNVFGEGEAGMEKFFLTLGTVGMMTVPTSIVTAAKKKAAGEEEGGELSKAIKRYEESLEINPTKENVAEGLEVLKEADSKVVEGITKEEEKVLTQKTKEDGKKEEVSIEDQKDGNVENEEEAKSEQEVVQEEVLEPTTDTTTEEEVAEEEVLENDLDIPEVQKELTEDEVKINSVNSLVKEYNSSKNKNKKSKLFQEINSKSSNLNLTIKTKDNGKIELLNKSGKLVRSKSVKKNFKDQPESDVNAVKKAIEVGILSDVKNTDYILPGISSGDVLKGIRDFSRGKFNTEPAKALTIAFRNARNQNEIGLRDKFSNAVKSDPKSVSLEEFNQELELESEEVLADQASRQVPQEAQDLVVSSVEEFAKEEGIESKEEIEDLKDLMSFAEAKTKSTTEETTTEETTTEESTTEEAVEEEVVEEETSIEELQEISSNRKLPKELRKLGNISKALKKIAPGVKFVFHKTEAKYNNSSDKDVSGSRGYRDGDKVHINLSSIKDNTTFHEAVHPILDAVFESSPETYNKLVNSIKTDPEFKPYFEKAKTEYKGENTQLNEAITEMMADVASGKFKKGTSIYEKVKDFIKDILTKLNLRQSDFNIDLSNEVDIRQFAENIGKALATGKEITFEKEGKLIQEKVKNKINKAKEVTKEGLAKGKDAVSKGTKSLVDSFDKNIELTEEKVKNKINKAKEVTKEGLAKGKDAVSKGTKSLVDAFNKAGEVISEGKVKTEESISDTKEKVIRSKDSTVNTINDIKRQAAKAKKIADKAYRDLKGSIKGKALDIYKSINNTTEITKDGFLKAAIQSRQFLDELIKSSAKVITKAEESIVSAVDTMKKLLVATSYVYVSLTADVASKGYAESGIDGAVFSIMETNPWILTATEGTDIGYKLETIYQRTGIKSGKLKGGEEVSIEDSKKGTETVKEVDTKEQEGVSKELQIYVASKTKFFQAKKKIALIKSGKPRGFTSHIENTFAADSGFIYFAGPTVSDKNNPFSVEGVAVAQFQLDGSVSDNQSYTEEESEYTKGHEGHYMHKFNDKILKIAEERNDYVPIFEKLGDNKVKVKYKRFNDLKPGERIMSPLRQFKFSEIAWGKDVASSDFAKGMKALPLKKGVKYPYPGKEGGNQTDIVFGSNYKNPRTGKVSKGADRYGIYEGIGAVFIFTDNKGVTFVKEFNGSANQIAAKGKEIIKEFGVNPDELTVGYHDVGSFSARPLAENGKVGTFLYTGKNFYNFDPHSGGALYYPPRDVNFQKKGDSAKKKLLKNQGFSDSEIEQILLDFENKKKAAAAVKKATVKGKPTKTVVRKNTGQSAPSKISVTEKSIVKRIIQAQNKAGKQTLKNKVSLFRELAKELGYKVIPKNINTRKAISLMRELNGLDATNSKKVKSFVERLDKTLSDTEESNRKSELSKRVKRISKLGKKTKGVRSDIANRLKNLNLNKIEDIETYNKLVQALEDSFKIKESMAEKSITPESLDAINKLEQEQEQTNEMILKDSYENSVLKAQGLTFEEYKHIQKRAGENAALALKKQALDTKQKNLQEKIDEFNNQIERFEAYADSVDSQDVLSESYKEAVRKLRKALKGVDVNLLSDSNINSIYNATEEMINYDSPAGVTQITNILIGSKKGQSLFTYSKSKGGIFSKTGSLAWKGLLNTNWENFISGVTKKISYAQEFTAKLMAEWDTAQAKANSRVTPLEERLNTISERKKGFVNIGVDSNGFQKIGVVSELLQHDSGITEQEIEQDFKDKKQDIKKNILVDRRIMKSSLKYSPEYNAASRRSKILQETLDIVNKYDSKADLQAAVDKGEILSKPELEYFNTVKEMFAELQPELRESLYMNTGQDLKMVENYTPTYKKTYSKVSDIETGSYGSTLSSSQSTGRTIQRVKPTGNTYNNYDFRETSLSGLRDVISDIETLPAKAQTNAVLNSKGYNKMFPKGSSLQASIESYLENIAKARESRNPADFSQQNRVSNAMRNLYSSLVAIPLKNTGQYIKQTVPIVTNTVFVNGVKKVSQAIMLMNSKDPAIQAKLEEVYSRSQTKNRTTLGDAQLDKSNSLMAKLLKNAYSPEGKGNIVSKGYSRLVEGALSIGDAYAARLTFVSSMLVELEKQGIDFDSDISNETISKADFTTNQINNTSDYTKTKQAFKGKSKNDKIIKDLLFLYKSFAMNQSATIANTIPKILRGDRQAIGLAVGSSVGLYTFHLIATMMRSAEKDLAEDLFGFNDDEIIDLVSGRSRKKRKKLFDEKDTKEEREREKLFSDIGNKTIVDFTTGWMPGIVDNLVKRSINLLADQFVSENRRLELEDMGIKKEDFIKIYDQDPGVLGLLSGQTGDVVNAISIIRNPDLDEKFKKPAYALLTSLILQEGNINKISKKLIYQSVKADKAIRKELNK